VLGAPSRQGIAASCSGRVQPLCRNWGILMVRFFFTRFSSDALQLGLFGVTGNAHQCRGHQTTKR
jgi:hypothetical protein